MRTPSFAELEAFFRIDGWGLERRTGHAFYEKVLPDGEILRSHASLAARKTMAPGRFRAILADQLRVSEAEFWEALRTGRAVERPSRDAATAPPGLPAWLWEALIREVGLQPDEIAALSEEEARAALTSVRSRPPRS